MFATVKDANIYIQVYTEDRNADYILVGLNHASPTILEATRANGT